MYRWLSIVCVSLSPMMKNLFLLYGRRPPRWQTRQGRVVCSVVRLVCVVRQHATRPHMYTLWSTAARRWLYTIQYNTIFVSFSHWYIAIRLRWCAGVCVSCAAGSRPKISPLQREGRASSCQPEQPSYRVGRPLAAADDGGQRRKEKDYRLFSVHIQQIFDLLQLFPFFSFFGSAWFFGWRALGRLSASWCARPIRKENPKKKLFIKMKENGNPPPSNGRNRKKKINEIDWI